MKLSNEVKIGIIAVVAVAVTYWGLNYLKGRNVLRSFDEYKVFYADIGGLEVNSKVYLSGFWVGQVNDIYFNPGKPGELIVVLGIKKAHKIPRNSVAVLSSDLMGTKSISIRISEAEQYHDSGDTLLSYKQPAVGDLLSQEFDPVKEKAEQLILSIDSFLISLNYIFDQETRDDLKASMTHLRNASGDIDILVSEKGRLNRILADIESISSNVKKHNEEISRALNNISAISDSVARSDLASVIYETNETLKYTHSIMKKIDQGEGTMGMLVNDSNLYLNLESSSFELDRLLKDLQENPGKYVSVSVFGGRKK